MEEQKAIPTPQQFYEMIEAAKSQLKAASEQITMIHKAFVDTYGHDKEYPVNVAGKPKWFRVYEPEGFFVYNRKWESGVRSTPENPA